MPRPHALTPKQQRFVDEYLIDLNATQAAIRAGYSARNADQLGPRLVGKSRVAEAIATRQAALAQALAVTQERVLREFALVGFADMARYATWGPDGVRLKDTESLTSDETRVVGEVSHTTTLAGGTVRFKLHDKIAALTKLGEHLGLFKPTPQDLPDIHVHVHAARERLTSRVAHLARRHAEDAANGV